MNKPRKNPRKRKKQRNNTPETAPIAAERRSLKPLLIISAAITASILGLLYKTFPNLPKKQDPAPSVPTIPSIPAVPTIPSVPPVPTPPPTPLTLQKDFTFKTENGSIANVVYDLNTIRQHARSETWGAIETSPQTIEIYSPHRVAGELLRQLQNNEAPFIPQENLNIQKIVNPGLAMGIPNNHNIQPGFPGMNQQREIHFSASYIQIQMGENLFVVAQENSTSPVQQGLPKKFLVLKVERNGDTTPLIEITPLQNSQIYQFRTARGTDSVIMHRPSEEALTAEIIKKLSGN